MYPFRSLEKTEAIILLFGPCLTRSVSIRPPPLTGIYEVPDSGSLIAREPCLSLRQEVSHFPVDQAGLECGRGTGDHERARTEPH